MKKTIQFSKPLGDLVTLKKDFYLKNELHLKNSLKINSKYLKEKERKNCKICNHKLDGFDFISHKIKYKLCNRCNHLNGKHIDSKKFINWLYKDSGGKNYSKNYLKNYQKRVNSIYLPKIEFLKKTIRKKQFSVIDFGSGGGHFLRACEMRKIKALGYEPSKILCNLGKKKLKKNKIHNVSMDYIYKKIVNEKADCLSLIGVLEHLEEPHKILEIFKKSKIKYLYISVPLFSFTSIIEHISPKIFPRWLSGGHTHLFTKESLSFLSKKYNFKIVGEWWFGLDFADLFRTIIVSSKNNKKFNKLVETYYSKYIDEFQSILDKNKISNEVHLIFKK